MRYCKLGFYILLISASSCNSPQTKVVQPKSDTTKVLEFAVLSAFDPVLVDNSNPSLFEPEIIENTKILQHPYHFKDSILFTSTCLPLALLPSRVDSFKFKILPEQEITAMLRADYDKMEIPRYLNVGLFEKSDTGYYVIVQSLSGMQFGSGQAAYLFIGKEKDSLFIKSKKSKTIN